MTSRYSLTVLTALITGALWAAPPLTTVRDTIYKADGSRFTGQVIVEWRSFEAADTSFIGRERLQVNVIDGFLSIRLVPTTNAGSPAYYLVRYVSGGNHQFQEAWAVKPSADPLRVRDVRVADPLLGPGSLPTGGGSTPENVVIGDVDGLQAELDIRPRKGVSFAPGAVAVVSATGELETAIGDPSHCIHVDGSSGPCGAGESSSAVFGTFVDGETPSGAANGSNAAFTLSQIPNPPASLLLYRNGMLQKSGLDFNLSNQVITFVPAALPQPGDILIASYRTAGSGGTLTQVICTGQGGATSSATSVALGSCSIPAGLLRAGDRIEVFYDYAHQGATTAFSIDVRWGASVLSARSLAAGNSLVTGRGMAAVHASGAQLSAQTWGASLALANESSAASDDINSGLTIDFKANMASATSDSVALRNFTVVRYPAP